MTNAELFTELFQTHIHRDGSDRLLNWLKSSDFFTAPASTKYHGNYEGGLLEYSLNVYNVLKHRLSEDDKLIVPDESVAIVALLHDVCKVNLYKKGFRNVKEDGVWVQKEVYETDEKFPCGDHSDKSIILLQQFIRLESEEMLAIRAHMGGWDAAARGGSQVINRIFERSRLAVHLHLADAEATYLIECEDKTE